MKNYLEKYYVLLIGVSEYYEDSSLTNIPNVEQNIVQMKHVLMDESILGIHESNIWISLNEDRSIVERKIIDLANKARNNDHTLLLYYSGHGLISPDDFKVYLATPVTKTGYIDIDSLPIEAIKKRLNNSQARKIIILDACYSGSIHNTMNHASSQISSELKSFEGTHIITSASQDSPSTFPVDNKNVPTYFTGELIKVIESGINGNSVYLTLNEIFNEVKASLAKKENIPAPQQSIYQNLHEMPFVKNKAFKSNIQRKDIDDIKSDYTNYLKDNKQTDYEKQVKSMLEMIDDEYDNLNNYNVDHEILKDEWKKALKKNTIWNYYNFIEKYPESKYVNKAENKIKQLEEEEKWNKALNSNSLMAYITYKRSYPMGKYIATVNKKISELTKIEKEKSLWEETLTINKISAYKEYLKKYPKGIYVHEAKHKLNVLQENLSRKDKPRLRNKKIIKRLLFVTVFMTGIYLSVEFYDIRYLNQYYNKANVLSITRHRDSIASRDVLKKSNDHTEIVEDKSNINIVIGKYEKLLEEGKRLEALGENYYNNALRMYYDAKKYDPNKNLADKYIYSLRVLINESFDKYIKNVYKFKDADGGLIQAKYYLDRALILKPGDIKAQKLLHELENSK